MESRGKNSTGISPVLLQAISERLSSRGVNSRAGLSSVTVGDVSSLTMKKTLSPQLKNFASNSEIKKLISSSRSKQLGSSSKSSLSNSPVQNPSRELDSPGPLHGEKAISIPDALLESNRGDVESNVIYMDESEGLYMNDADQPRRVFVTANDGNDISIDQSQPMYLADSVEGSTVISQRLYIQDNDNIYVTTNDLNKQPVYGSDLSTVYVRGHTGQSVIHVKDGSKQSPNQTIYVTENIHKPISSVYIAPNNSTQQTIYVNSNNQTHDSVSVEDVVLCYPDDVPAQCRPLDDVVIAPMKLNESDGKFVQRDEDIVNNVLQYVNTGCDGGQAMEVGGSGAGTAGTSRKSTTAPVVDSRFLGQLCPVCGDKVSGYHYGVVSCESCKGFFKRTVQNRRTFVCPRQGDCNIHVVNRKKCPSCRFTRCVLAGMKVEAIRTDRSRGGRSYYEGCSPRIRPKPDIPKHKMPPKPYSRGESSHLVAILSAQTPSRMHIPQLLVDIMALETMLEDKTVMEIDDTKSNPADYSKLLQLAELRLYKLVRWARALPQFSSIPTEDQIILLQNSWLDLLVLGVAYSSMCHNGNIHISTTFEWTLADAQAIGMDAIFSHVTNLADLMERIKLDKYECAVLKVLAIISPDVEGLTARPLVLDHQHKLTEALHAYIESHYPGQRNRFSKIILLLSGLIKASMLGKTLLSSETLGEHFYQCDLLMELIQGRNNPNPT